MNVFCFETDRSITQLSDSDKKSSRSIEGALYEIICMYTLIIEIKSILQTYIYVKVKDGKRLKKADFESGFYCR